MKVMDLVMFPVENRWARRGILVLALVTLVWMV